MLLTVSDISIYDCLVLWLHGAPQQKHTTEEAVYVWESEAEKMEVQGSDISFQGTQPSVLTFTLAVPAKGSEPSQ